MAEKKKNLYVWLWSALGVVVLIFGIVEAIVTYFYTRDMMVNERTTHLLDLTYSTDRNIDNLIEECYIRIQSSSESDDLKEIERQYFEFCNYAPMRETVKNNPVINDKFISRLLVMQNGEVLEQTESADISYYFPYGYDIDIPSFCYDSNGAQFLAVSAESHSYDIVYTALIDVNELLHSITGSRITNEYWLVIYW